MKISKPGKLGGKLEQNLGRFQENHDNLRKVKGKLKENHKHLWKLEEHQENLGDKHFWKPCIRYSMDW